MNDIVAVSACLLGIRCRYDGGSCYDRRVVDFVRDKIIVPVCPEIFGGHPTPPEACEPGPRRRHCAGQKRVRRRLYVGI